MRKRNTFTPLLSNKVGCHGLGSWFKILAVFLFLCPFVIPISCERQKEIRPQSKTNSPPVITSVKVLPEKPNVGSELSVIVQSNDPDADSVTYQYQWIKNDENMLEENKNTLRAGTLRKGDIIQVKVTPSDGKEGGKPFLSSPVKVLNSPPVIQEVWIEPKTPSVKDKSQKKMAKKIYVLPKYIDEKEKHLYPFIK